MTLLYKCTGCHKSFQTDENEPNTCPFCQSPGRLKQRLYIFQVSH